MTSLPTVPLGAGHSPNLPKLVKRGEAPYIGCHPWQVGDRGVLNLKVVAEDYWIEVECIKIVDVRFVFFMDNTGMTYGFEAWRTPVKPVDWDWNLWPYKKTDND